MPGLYHLRCIARETRFSQFSGRSYELTTWEIAEEGEYENVRIYCPLLDTDKARWLWAPLEVDSLQDVEGICAVADIATDDFRGEKRNRIRAFLYRE